MIINVKVKAGSGKQEIEMVSEGIYNVSLKERAEDGKANLELIKLLKKEFKGKVEMNNIKIIKGRRNKDKIVRLE